MKPPLATQRRAPPPPANLGRTAARGLLWMMTQTIGVKLVSLIANVIIALFLLPDEAGLVGMAYTVLSIAGFIQYIGMQDVLVRRQAHFRRWANPAFWMSLTIGLLGGALVAAAAPFAAQFYDEPRLVGMVLLLALASPLQTISIVPQAQLSAELRFRTSVVIGTVAAVGISLLSVILAWLGFGAYSFLIPVPIMALLQSAALWWAAKPRICWSPQVKRWKYLLGDTGYNAGVSICLIIITTIDHIVIGRMFSREVLGIYFWAVNLSTQLLRLLAMNLMNVLLPSLSRLQDDPERQTAAFLQATRILAMVGIPACLLQAALAQPLVRILYKHAWEGVGPVLAALSIGMAFYFVSGPATSMMKSQGRFRAAFMLYITHAIVISGAVLSVAMRANDSNAAIAVSIAVAACLAVFGPIYLYEALQPSGHGWRSVGRVFAAPTIASVLSLGAAMGVSHFIPQLPERDFYEITVTTLISGVIYPLLIRVMDHEAWSFAVARVRRLRGHSSADSSSA